jgi:hypothetical protein
MTNSPKKQKLHCFVDETGQDTKGELFIVAVVVDDVDPEALRQILAQIEEKSPKGARKWYKTNRERRLAYISRIVDSGAFTNKIFFAHYQQTLEFFGLTIDTIAKAIELVAEESYEATVLIDGLSKSMRQHATEQLRKKSVKVRKLRGIDDESDALIRLADAMAGFVRLGLEGDAEFRSLFDQAISAQIIREVK